MIDLKAEAEKIADGQTVMGQDAALADAIIDLCTRYGNEKLEEAAKVCDEIALKRYGRVRNAYSTAIRARKEEEG